jgi:hypothetical protein
MELPVPPPCEVRRTPWPADLSGRGSNQPRVGIVVASFNTRRLIAHLIFSLYRLLGRSEFSELVVVDNASTDGSRELLNTLHRSGLIQLIRNRTQGYHGPALTQGISWLARRQRIVAASERFDYVWILDSDVVVLRPDTVRDALAYLSRTRAAAVGQKLGDPAYDRLLRHNREMLQPCSLILDPAAIWRPPIPPFLEDGAPANALQVGADEQGLRLAAFPFVENGYLLHLGRGTLRSLADANDTANRYYDWAIEHCDYHFGGHASGARCLASFTDLFDAEVGELGAASLAGACLRTDLLRLDVR